MPKLDSRSQSMLLHGEQVKDLGDDKLMTIHVVDDDPQMLRLLQSILERHGLGVRTWENPRAYLEEFTPGQDTCLVLDLRMPEMGGLELLQEIRRLDSGLPVVIVTGDADVPSAVQAVKLGATDVVEKPFAPSALMEAVNRALGEDAESRLRRREEADAIARISRLTEREREVLRLLAQGSSLKDVAEKLHRSYKTADNHKMNLMRKLEVHDRVALARLAIRAGVVEV